MKIYSMTATFGKLEHQTLALTPGLNIIEAPNEWGKSTWCAFLVAMLYGINTRERNTQGTLADKEHYAPWSGKPMSGRMDLNWNGRDITIERSTKGRTVFGQFRAYETHTHVDVPELTADNCGDLLLGVEKNVFTKAGFLRLSDLPVTDDEALRRRLNSLVTTGDESGTSDALAQKLKELKNHCRHNKTGLLPQAEAQRDALEKDLQEIRQLQEQSLRIQTRQADLTAYITKLETHQAALEYAAAQEYAQKSAAAQLHLEHLTAKAQELEATCAALPSTEALLQKLSQLQQLREEKESLHLQAQMRQAAPTLPEPPAPFRGCTPEQALQQAQEDQAAWEACGQKKLPLWPMIAGIFLSLAGLVFLLLKLQIPGLILLPLGICIFAGTLILSKKQNQEARALAERLSARYRPLPPALWEEAARSYAQSQQTYQEALTAYHGDLTQLNRQLEALDYQLQALTGGTSYLQCEQTWKSMLEQHKAYADILREQHRTEEMVRAFRGDQPLPQPPQAPDTLDFTQAETTRLLSDAELEMHQLQLKLGQCQGQMNALGQETHLQQQLDALQAKITKLEDTYAALTIAQETLAAASTELQRRFAPRISRQTQTLFSKLTGNRYDRLTLGQDLSLNAGAQGEDVLRSTLWRSDGTVDQLYLALRLAVARELTPEAPLILDDALVRFDDARLEAAIEILQEEAQSKQVILFTCQSREKAIAEKNKQ